MLLLVNFHAPGSGSAFLIRIRTFKQIRIHADPDIGNFFANVFFLLQLIAEVVLSIHSLIILGHTDAVWDLSYNPGKQQLLSSSADGSVRQSHHLELTRLAFVTVTLLLKLKSIIRPLSGYRNIVDI